MSVVDFGGIIVAIIAALGAWVAQRAAAKSSNINTSVTGRLDLEKDAYERARNFDTETMRRQNEEIIKLRAESLKFDEDMAEIKGRLADLQKLLETSERKLNEFLEANGD
jgi:hypothetical protein